MTHIIVEQIDLKNAISFATKVTDTKGSVPTLAGICFEAKGGNLDILATDLEAWIKVKIQEKTDETFSILVDGKKINDIVNRFVPGSQIKIALDDDGGRINLTSTGKKYTIPILPIDDFPHFTNPEDGQTQITVSAETVNKATNVTLPSISLDTARYYLNGIFVHAVEGILKFVSTDGHRLHLYDLTSIDKEFEGVILPRKAVNIVTKLTQGITDINLLISPSYIQFKTDYIEYTTKVIDADYPPYDRIIPKDNEINIKLNINKTESAIKDVLAATEGANGSAVVFMVQNDQFIACNAASAANIGECVSVIDDNFKAKDSKNMQWGFCGNYMLDAIAVLKREYGNAETDHLNILFGGEVDQFLITHAAQKIEGNNRTTLLIMPLRV